MLGENLNDVITHSIFMKFYNKSTKGISKRLILIEHKRAEIRSREVNRQLWWKKLILRHCYLELEPKFTNFNGIRASATSNHVAKTASKSVHPFGWNIVYWQTRHTYIDKLQWKYNPSTVSWRCKKLHTKLIRFRNL